MSPCHCSVKGLGFRVQRSEFRGSGLGLRGTTNGGHTGPSGSLVYSPIPSPINTRVN